MCRCVTLFDIPYPYDCSRQKLRDEHHAGIGPSIGPYAAPWLGRHIDPNGASRRGTPARRPLPANSRVISDAEASSSGQRPP